MAQFSHVAGCPLGFVKLSNIQTAEDVCEAARRDDQAVRMDNFVIADEFHQWSLRVKNEDHDCFNYCEIINSQAIILDLKHDDESLKSPLQCPEPIKSLVKHSKPMKSSGPIATLECRLYELVCPTSPQQESNVKGKDIVLSTMSGQATGKNDYHLCAEEPVVPNKHCIAFIISYVESPSRFWVNVKSDAAGSQMTFVTDELNECCNKMTTLMARFINNSEPKLGEVYCTRYHIDDRFYRVKVVDMCSKKLKMLYIDFGNCEWLTVDNLLPLPLKFAAVPPLAACFSLHGIRPAFGNQWLPEAIDWFDKRAEVSKSYFGYIANKSTNKFLR